MSLKQFQVLNKLGEGAYSSVYRVQRLKDSTDYALKKVKLSNLSQKEHQNALNEVRILASIRNPNIVAYKQAFIEGGNLCVVMEYADDGDLYQKIVEKKKNGQVFEEEQIWRVLVQVTRGLSALHRLNIFHRDLKSANVFLCKDNTAKLGDMNVSKIAKNGLLYTQTGTPYYASPEVWMDKPYDSKSDIWSLGCVIYEMTTLKPPFRAEDMEGLYKKVVKGVYPKIPQTYSQDLSNAIKIMLQVNPSLRPSSDKLLQSPIFQKKINELELNEQGEASPSVNSQLLKTIRMPKNLHYLTDRLPKPNYLKQLDVHDSGTESGERGGIFKHITSPDKDSGLPILDKSLKNPNKRKLTKDYLREREYNNREYIRAKDYEHPVSLQINKLYNVKSYKNPTVIHRNPTHNVPKQPSRNVSLPPIKA